MDPNVRAKLIEDTKEHAIAFVEDLESLKQTFSSEPTDPAKLRHASVVLRRWLVEGLLARLASPRIGRLYIDTIDNRVIHGQANEVDTQFFQSAGAMVHGIWLSGIMLSDPYFAKRLNYLPDKRIVLKIDDFRKQRVIYSLGRWFSRDQVIKFVANVADGVHAGKAKEQWEADVGNVRQVITVREDTDEAGNVILKPSVFLGDQLPDYRTVNYKKNEINAVFLEILSTFYFISTSRKIDELVGVIKTELGIDS